MNGLGAAIPCRHSYTPQTVIPALTVIPTQAGTQKCPIGSMPVFDNTVLDSRLRGNDGRAIRNKSPMSFRA